MRIFRPLSTLAYMTTALLWFYGCGRPDQQDVMAPLSEAQDQIADSEDATADDTSADAVPEEEVDGPIQLKGVNLIGQSLFNTLGPKKDMSGRVDDNGDEISLLDEYGSIFGKTEGLRFGEVYSDSLSTAYLLALSIVASNAADRCRSEIYAQGGTELYNGKCKCNTPESAQAMLSRAYPFVDVREHADMVDEFVALCQENYRSAIQALVGSISFARKSS